MKSLTDTRSLRWHQNDELTFSLRDPEQTVYATLQFRSTSGSLAIGESSEGQWTIKRVGFFKPCISARPAGQETTVAFFQRARLHFGEGRVLLWRPWRPAKGSRKGRWFEDAQGHRVVQLQSEFAARKYEAHVKIEVARTRGVELSIAVLMIWYIVLLLQRQNDVAMVNSGPMMMMSHSWA